MELVTDEELGPILLLYHEFDNDYMMLKGMGEESFNQIKEFIGRERSRVYKNLIEKVDDTNMYSIGKVLLQIHGIEDFPYPGSIVTVKINLNPFITETEEVSQSPLLNSCDINQQFLM